MNSYETKKEKFAPTGEFKLKLLENRGDSPNTSMNLQIEIGNGVMLKTKGSLTHREGHRPHILYCIALTFNSSSYSDNFLSKALFSWKKKKTVKQ